MDSDEKWATVRVLRGIKEQIDKICDDPRNGFANSTQYISHVLKNDLDQRLKK